MSRALGAGAHGAGPAAPVGPVVECVPNVSEGRDTARIAGFASAIADVPGTQLVDVHVDPDHHRSVFSFLGPPAAVEASALALASAIFAAIDMREHRGVHPRVGALDVVPFVPLAGVEMPEVAALARSVGRTIGERHQLPIYYYGEAAEPARRWTLAELRRGGYEGLRERLQSVQAPPDAGPARFDAAAGAVLVGARPILVAFNVWLDRADLAVARAIAAAVRESAGGLPRVQALGLLLASREVAQVSMNLLDYRTTAIPAAWDRVNEEAARRGVGVLRGELVGLAPRAAFAGRSPGSVGLADVTTARLLDSYVALETAPDRAGASSRSRSDVRS